MFNRSSTIHYQLQKYTGIPVVFKAKDTDKLLLLLTWPSNRLNIFENKQEDRTERFSFELRISRTLAQQACYTADIRRAFHRSVLQQIREDARIIQIAVSGRDFSGKVKCSFIGDLCYFPNDLCKSSIHGLNTARSHKVSFEGKQNFVSLKNCAGAVLSFVQYVAHSLNSITKKMFP